VNDVTYLQSYITTGDKKKMSFVKASFTPGYADSLLFNIKNRK
jgi:hypothetical protein